LARAAAQRAAAPRVQALLRGWTLRTKVLPQLVRETHVAAAFCRAVAAALLAARAAPGLGAAGGGVAQGAAAEKKAEQAQLAALAAEARGLWGRYQGRRFLQARDLFLERGAEGSPAMRRLAAREAELGREREQLGRQHRRQAEAMAGGERGGGKQARLKRKLRANEAEKAALLSERRELQLQHLNVKSKNGGGIGGGGAEPEAEPLFLPCAPADFAARGYAAALADSDWLTVDDLDADLASGGGGGGDGGGGACALTVAEVARELLASAFAGGEWGKRQLQKDATLEKKEKKVRKGGKEARGEKGGGKEETGGQPTVKASESMERLRAAREKAKGEKEARKAAKQAAAAPGAGATAGGRRRSSGSGGRSGGRKQSTDGLGPLPGL
jgi:hypothetical protein